MSVATKRKVGAFARRYGHQPGPWRPRDLADGSVAICKRCGAKILDFGDGASSFPTACARTDQPEPGSSPTGYSTVEGLLAFSQIFSMGRRVFTRRSAQAVIRSTRL